MSIESELILRGILERSFNLGRCDDVVRRAEGVEALRISYCLGLFKKLGLGLSVDD